MEILSESFDYENWERYVDIINVLLPYEMQNNNVYNVGQLFRNT